METRHLHLSSMSGRKTQIQRDSSVEVDAKPPNVVVTKVMLLFATKRWFANLRQAPFLSSCG